MVEELDGIEVEHLDLPWRSASKKELCGGTMKSSFESFTKSRPNALRTRQMEEMVKLESPGQNAIE